MKYLITVIFIFSSYVVINAQSSFTSFDDISKKSEKDKKPILMVFSGSDWCKPCMQLKKDVIENGSFSEVESRSIFVYVDFPYKKENQLPKAHKDQNEELAEKYNPKGVFPQILVISSTGIIKDQLRYNSSTSPEDFIKQIIQKL